MSFEPNRGQAAERYRFLAQDTFGVFLLAGDELVYGRGGDNVRVVFAGANTNANIAGLDERAGRINYLVGNDPSRWIRDVPSYGRVRVRQLYRGIDAVYYGSGGSLETDFVVEPGGDPQAVALRIQARESLPLHPPGTFRCKRSAV